jgi:phosphotransferase system enzyme I (PtsI)
VDRHNRDVAYLYRPLHLSLLRSIQNIVSAAKGANIPVSMCGEMAGDPVYTLVLLALGFNELSMTAGQIPVVKQLIRKVTQRDAKVMVDSAMRLSTSEEIERYIRSEITRLVPEAS